MNKYNQSSVEKQNVMAADADKDNAGCVWTDQETATFLE